VINTYYAYIHRKPNGTPFYVGKGTLRRANSLKQRNPYYLATVKKYGVENIVVNSFECDSEEDAFELEMFLIECLKESGVKLTNCTDGGEGASGHVHSEEVRARMSAFRKGRPCKPHSAETRAKIKESNKGKVRSAETRANISRAGKGMIRKPFSEEHKANMSIAAKKNGISEACRTAAIIKKTGSTASTETREKMSRSLKGKTPWNKGKAMSEETRAKMSVAKKGKICRPLSKEHKANISAAQKARYKNK
jgi:group I intron endonuclease